LTPLSVRFIKLGITLERIAPGKPQQNGCHERFHLTMLPLAKAPEADRIAQGQAFEAFRRSYNEERPHE
ncbi:MAG: transposase, partial [Mesorhizobium sp.]